MKLDLPVPFMASLSHYQGPVDDGYRGCRMQARLTHLKSSELVPC